MTSCVFLVNFHIQIICVKSSYTHTPVHPTSSLYTDAELDTGLLDSNHEKVI